MPEVIHVISRRVFPVAIFLTLPLKQQSEGKAWDKIKTFFLQFTKAKWSLSSMSGAPRSHCPLSMRNASQQLPIFP